MDALVRSLDGLLAHPAVRGDLLVDPRSALYEAGTDRVAANAVGTVLDGEGRGVRDATVVAVRRFDRRRILSRCPLLNAGSVVLRRSRPGFQPLIA